MDDPWQRVSAFEQEDQLLSLAQIGAKAARIYPFSVPKFYSATQTHILVTAGYGTSNATWRLNEDLMVDLDRALVLARKHDIRLIIPLIDYWQWWGGAEEFSKIFGFDKPAFFAEPIVIQQFKLLCSRVLGRNNTLTNITYMHDPHILAWETINEGPANNAEWTLEIARHLKSLDPTHLVLDGTYPLLSGWDERVVNSPHIDIFSNHYYPLAVAPSSYPPYFIAGIVGCAVIAVVLLCVLVRMSCARDALRIPGCFRSSSRNVLQTRLSSNRNRVLALLGFLAALGGLAFCIVYPVAVLGNDLMSRIESDRSRLPPNKCMIIGELGMFAAASVDKVFQKYPSPEIPGVLIWSLRGHSDKGGYFTHAEGFGYYAYHLPAGPPNPSLGFANDEQQVVQILTSALARIGSSSSETPPPPPTVISSSHIDTQWALSWQGCTGCEHYSLYSNGRLLDSGITDRFSSGHFTYSLNTTDTQSIVLVGYGSSWNVSAKITL
ncbi:hypothetical protein HDV03_000817 [Kappamyces sp. JEL0829]|nr:hypothetical protein HDV03_000817 [Kappamyces sp. JEL0829]